VPFPAFQLVRLRACSVVLLALLVVATPAQGETADGAPVSVTLLQPEALPFSESELVQALLAQLPAPAGEPTPADGPGLPRAEVEPAGAGAVTVHVGGRSRVVVVGDRSGAGAARVVALVIAELLGADAEADATGPTAAEQPAVVATGGAATGEPPASLATGTPTSQSAAEPGWTPRLCVTAGAVKGTSTDELWAGRVNADLVMPWGPGRLRFAPSAGLTVMPTHNGGTVDQVSFVGVALRALVGPSLGPVDVLGGPVVSAYRIGGVLPHAGALFGAEAMARLAVPLWDQLRLVADARVDAFANRARVIFAGGQTFATPRVGFGGGVGLAWDWTP
jgi:hypothetical protein